MTRPKNKCPRPMQVQSVLFSKSAWNSPDAKGWLEAHGFAKPRADVKGNYLRFRQLGPGKCTRGSFRTATLSIAKRIKAVICCPTGR